MISLYGIKNCDTMKKALKWLDEASVSYEFHDYKKQGLSEALVDEWLSKLGWEALINRRGTTWRKLDESIRENMDSETARQVMLDNPSIIKRPLMHSDGEYLLGFKAAEYEAKFK